MAPGYDLFSSKCSSCEGLNELGKRRASMKRVSSTFAARAAERADSFLRNQSRAGSLRAIWENAYALQRLQQGSACLAIVDGPRSGLDGMNYPWLASQFRLEHAVCSSMMGQLRTNENDVQEAFSIADSARYDTLLLAGCQHLMGIQVAAHDADEAWSWFARGLSTTLVWFV